MKVELQSYCFSDPRLKRLGSLLGCGRYTALGLLADLWHDTQEALKSSCSRQWIESVLHLDPAFTRASAIDHVIGALVDAEYLSEEEDGTILIRGNEKHVRNMLTSRDKAKKAADARWDRIKRETGSSTLSAQKTGCLEQCTSIPPNGGHQVDAPPVKLSASAPSMLQAFSGCSEHATSNAPGHATAMLPQATSHVLYTVNLPPPPSTSSVSKADGTDCLFNEQPTKAERKRPEPSKFDLDLGRRWADLAKQELPHLKPEVADYADAIRLLRSDGFSHEQLERIFKFIRDDNFWRDKALSPRRLRTKKRDSELRKIDTLIASMKRSGKPLDRVDPYAGRDLLAEIKRENGIT